MHSLDRLVALRLLASGLDAAADVVATNILYPPLQSNWSNVKCLDEPADNRVVKLRQWPVPSIATRIIPRR